MNRKELKMIKTRIDRIRKAAEDLRNLSGGIQAIDRNVARILASTKMLEINFSDILEFSLVDRAG